MIRNPFFFGRAIRDPAMFVGRRQEVQEVFQCILSGADCVIVGERRIGKSSLLRYIADPTVTGKNGLEVERFVFVYFNCQGFPNVTWSELWALLLSDLQGQLADQAFGDYMTGVRSKAEITMHDLSQLFQHLNDQGKNAILLFDEFGAATSNPNLNKDFYGGLRYLSNNLRVNYIVTTQRPLLELQYAYPETMTSPFFNTFHRVTLGPFTPEDVTTLLDTALADTDVTFTSDDRRFIDRMAGRHPFFTQMAAYHLFAAYVNEYLRRQEVYSPWVTQRLRDNSTEHWRYYWDHSENGEKLILATLSLVERGDIEKYHLNRAFDEGMLRRLRDRSLIIEREGEPTVFSALFSDWITDEVSFITTDRIDDFDKLMVKARAKDLRDRWLDTSERIRRGFARIDVRAITEWLLEGERVEHFIDLLTGLVRILPPGP
jgi:hypothetical protein